MGGRGGEAFFFGFYWRVLCERERERERELGIARNSSPKLGLALLGEWWPQDPQQEAHQKSHAGSEFLFFFVIVVHSFIPSYEPCPPFN